MATPATRKIYNSAAWKLARQARLDLDAHACTWCGHSGDRLEVHHRVPLAEGGAPFDIDNLQTLCFWCHIEIHARLVDDPGRLSFRDDLNPYGPRGRPPKHKQKGRNPMAFWSRNLSRLGKPMTDEQLYRVARALQRGRKGRPIPDAILPDDKMRAAKRRVESGKRRDAPIR